MASPPPGYFNVSLHGRYYQPASLGRLYSGGNQAVVATGLSAGLPTTYTGGLVLYNPLNSGIVITINEAKFAFLAAQTNASVIGLALGYNATTAPTGTLTVVPSQSANVGGSAPAASGVLYSSASVALPTAPYLARILAVTDTGATTGGVAGESGSYDVAGGIILQPGAYCCFSSSAAGTANSFFGAFVWEEIASGAL